MTSALDIDYYDWNKVMAFKSLFSYSSDEISDKLKSYIIKCEDNDTEYLTGELDNLTTALYKLKLKIIGYQQKEEESLNKAFQQFSEGTFKGHVEVSGNFSTDLFGDDDSARASDIPDQLARVHDYCKSKKYEKEGSKFPTVEANDMKEFIILSTLIDELTNFMQ